MIDIKRDTDNIAFKWLCLNLGVLESEVPNTMTAAITNDDKVIGAVVFSMFNAKNCYLSFHTESPEWATKKVIRWIINTCFEQFGAKKITCNTDRNNKAMRGVLERIGFILEGCIEYGRPDGGDACYYRFNEKSKKLSKFFREKE
jgi:RimJ/RimL family protein N-acetyltransferase